MSIKTICAGVTILAVLAFALPASAEGYATGRENQSFSELKTNAESGDRNAQLELGRRYYYEKKDNRKALEWFRKAAEQGVPWAEYETAAMYIGGEGTPADPVTAMTWYRKAAADGIMVANLDIGVMYWLGEGVEKDSAEAARWLQIAADAGEPRAQFILGLLYRDGDGVTQDYAEAMRLFRASAAQRWAQAAYALGDMIKQGKGTEKNLVVGQAWRIMGKYLEATPESVPQGAKVVGAVLVSPDLTEEENKQAQDYYFRLMAELGFNSPS